MLFEERLLFGLAVVNLHVLEVGYLVQSLIVGGGIGAAERDGHIHKVHRGIYAVDFIQNLFEFPAAVGAAEVLYFKFYARRAFFGAALFRAAFRMAV